MLRVEEMHIRYLEVSIARNKYKYISTYYDAYILYRLAL